MEREDREESQNSAHPSICSEREFLLSPVYLCLALSDQTQPWQFRMSEVITTRSRHHHHQPELFLRNPNYPGQQP